MMKSLSYKHFAASTGKAVTLATCLSLLAACTPQVNADKLEGLVKDEFAKQTGIAVKAVTCPEDIEIEAGNTFDCEIEAENGKTIKAKVTQEDDEGNVKWNANEGLISLAAIEKSVVEGFQQKKIEVTADCGGQYKIATQGDKFTCDVKDTKGETGKVEVAIKNNEGSFEWKLLK